MKKPYNTWFACFYLMLLSGTGPVWSQGVNLGIPPIRNYPKSSYQAGTQNWDAAQDSRGVMYFANNNGLLRYDGSKWTCLPVGNHTNVRAVAIDSTDRIFVGAQSELGYFSPDPRGVLAYHSLLPLLPESGRSFEDVWDIVFYQGDVFFRTNTSVFQYTAGKMAIHQASGPLFALFSTPRGLFLQQGFSELLQWKDGRFSPGLRLPGLNSSLTGALAWRGDSTLLTSLKDGIFYLWKNQVGPWRTELDARLREKRIYSVALLPDQSLCLGSSLEGLLILDDSRRLVRHLTKKNGLQNNDILHTFCDRDGNLWLGLDNGIDQVVLNSPFSFVFPDGEMQGTGYAAALFQDKLYLGVSNGAYVVPWRPFYDPRQGTVFRKVANSDGQVWNLEVIGNQLLMGHHEGAFRLVNDQALRLSDEQGSWTFVALDADHLLEGTYKGLSLYSRTATGWQAAQALDQPRESCRILVRDQDGTAWVSHPYRGLFHVTWPSGPSGKAAVRFYDQKFGLPSNLNNYVFSIAGKAVFATEKGVYRFDRAGQRFLPDPDFERMLGRNGRVHYLAEDASGNIWYAREQEVGVMLVDDLGLKKEVKKRIFPELRGKLVGGFERIYPVDKNNILIGTEQGFILYDRSKDRQAEKPLTLLFSQVQASGNRDSLLAGEAWLASGMSKPTVLESGLNTLSFYYTATSFEHPELIQYKVKLSGLEGNWSEWSAENKKEYSNLTAGSYVFQVQARIGDGRTSKVLEYAFRIRPPWYKSHLALFLYATGVFALFAGFVFRQQWKFETEKARMAVTQKKLEARHIRAVQESRAALDEAQHEKLQVEIKFKNQELALTTMHLVQKAEILLSLKEALDKILKLSTNPTVKKEIQQLVNLLNFDVNLDEDWEHFAHYFDQVHVDFLKRLREKFPNLGSNDYKLCAYLRMGLSTKEIAPLMNISVRGVEGSRYRLRRKLNLGSDENLTEFIMSLTPAPEPTPGDESPAA